MRRAALWLAFLLPALSVAWIFAREEGPRFMVILEAWQTLTAGLVAIGAAFIGAAAVNRQTRLQEQRANEIRDAKFDAELAHLTVTLSEIAEYADDWAKRLFCAWERSHGRGAVNVDEPEFPSGAIRSLATMIEAAPDQETRRAFGILIRRLQVHFARVSGLMDLMRHAATGAYMRAQMAGWVVDTAEVYAHMSENFRFAREEIARPNYKMTLQRVEEGLHQLGFDPADHPEVFTRARTRFSN